MPPPRRNPAGVRVSGLDANQYRAARRGRCSHRPGNPAAPQTPEGRRGRRPLRCGKHGRHPARMVMGAKFMRRGGIHPARGTLPRRERPRAGNARPYGMGQTGLPPTNAQPAVNRADMESAPTEFGFGLIAIDFHFPHFLTAMAKAVCRCGLNHLSPAIFHFLFFIFNF